MIGFTDLPDLPFFFPNFWKTVLVETWLLFASTVLRQSSAWYKSGEIDATTKRLNNFSGFNQGMSVAPVSPQMEEDGPRGIGDVASSKPCCKNGHEMVISDYAEGGYQYNVVSKRFFLGHNVNNFFSRRSFSCLSFANSS